MYGNGNMFGAFPQYPYGQQFNQSNQMYGQQNTQPKQNISWINVNGLQGARDVQIQANQTAWLMDMNAPVFYMKQADSMGVCTLKAYRFEEIDPQQQNGATTAYVTREEFEALKNEIRASQQGVKHESDITAGTAEQTTEHYSAV